MLGKTEALRFQITLGAAGPTPPPPRAPCRPSVCGPGRGRLPGPVGGAQPGAQAHLPLTRLPCSPFGEISLTSALVTVGLVRERGAHDRHSMNINSSDIILTIIWGKSKSEAYPHRCLHGSFQCSVRRNRFSGLCGVRVRSMRSLWRASLVSCSVGSAPAT